MAKQARKGIENITDTEFPPWLRSLDAPDYDDATAILREDKCAMELARETPCLFFLLVRAGREQGLSVEDIRPLTRLPRRKLLAALECNASASAERLLRRCEFTRLTDLQVLALRALIADIPPGWQRHIKRPNLNLLTKISFQHWAVVSPVMDGLMNQYFAENPDCARIDCGFIPWSMFWEMMNADIEEIVHIIYLIEQEFLLSDENEARRGTQSRMRALARCRTSASLQALHQQIATIGWEELVAAAVGDKPWPEAPLPGCEHIEAIASGQEILDESHVQHHCVASYASRVMQRQGYVYRVLQPERGTVYITPSNGVWVIGEIRLAFNAAASGETVNAVRKWLNANQGRGSGG